MSSTPPKFIYSFFLPVRLLAQAFVAGRAHYLQCLADPDRRRQPVGRAEGHWRGRIRVSGRTVPLDARLGPWAAGISWLGSSIGIGRLFAWVGRTILNVFLNLPIVRLLRAALGGVF